MTVVVLVTHFANAIPPWYGIGLPEYYKPRTTKANQCIWQLLKNIFRHLNTYEVFKAKDIEICVMI